MYLSHDRDLDGEIGRSMMPVLPLEIVGSIKSATSSAGSRDCISEHPDFEVYHQGSFVKLRSSEIKGRCFDGFVPQRLFLFATKEPHRWIP